MSSATVESLAPTQSARQSPSRLELIHQPPSAFAHMDIVLVHGLGGGKRHTWTRSISKQSYFWPDWIAEHTSLKNARVYLFGYKASKNWKPYRKSIAEPGDFARQLLSALGERDSNVRGVYASGSILELSCGQKLTELTRCPLSSWLTH